MGHQKAIALTCFVALLWSLAGLNIKVIEWPAFAITGGRSFIAFVMLTPLVMQIKNKHIDRYVIAGALFYAAFGYCYILSTKLTTSAMAVVMQYTAPIYVALLSWLFLGERVTKADTVCMIFVFSGILLFFLDKFGGGSFWGNVLAIFNGVFFAGLVICFRLQKNAHPVMSIYLGNFISMLIGMKFVFQAGAPSFSSFIFLIVLGFQIAVTYSLYSKASTGLTALETVLLPIIDPILNPVWVYLFVGEKPGALSIIGGMIVLISITVRVVYSLRNDRG